MIRNIGVPKLSAGFVNVFVLSEFVQQSLCVKQGSFPAKKALINSYHFRINLFITKFTLSTEMSREI